MKLLLPGFDQLRTRLLYLVLVALLPACGLVLFGNFEQQNLEKEALRQQAIASAKLAAATQERYILNARHLLLTLCQFPFLTLSSDRGFSETHFRNLRLISPDYADFGLIESDGRLFCAASVTNQNPYLTNMALFRKVVASKTFGVAELEESWLDGSPALRCGFPVLTNGQVHRVVFAAVHLRLLSDALTNIALPQGSRITVMDHKTNVIARFPDPENWVGRNLHNWPHIQRLFAVPETSLEAVGMDQVQRLFASTTLTDESGGRFVVVVGIPTALLYAHANQKWMRNSIALLVVAIFVLAAAAVFARLFFIKPVNRIVAAAQRLAGGDYTARADLGAGETELHQLGRAFDRMAANLARDEAKLRAANAEISTFNAELERRVLERTAQLEATNRELEAFSYSVSHDLRAPLRHLDGFAQILSTEPALQGDERIRRYLALITKSAKKMGRLIDDLLSFSRMGRKTMVTRNVNMGDLVRTAVADLKQEQEGRSIEWDIATLPPVMGDAAMLQQVWLNLVSNALKYTRGRQPARIEIGCRQEPGETIFFIQDNGAGFEMKYADKLFGVFQRLHKEDEFEGTGIGLANVRRIIARHHGRTWAEAELDRGATIFFSLPVAPANPP